MGRRRMLIYVLSFLHFDLKLLKPQVRVGDIMAMWGGGGCLEDVRAPLLRPRTVCPTQTLMATASVLVIKHQLITSFHSASLRLCNVKPGEEVLSAVDEECVCVCVCV